MTAPTIHKVTPPPRWHGDDQVYTIPVFEPKAAGREKRIGLREFRWLFHSEHLMTISDAKRIFRGTGAMSKVKLEDGTDAEAITLTAAAAMLNTKRMAQGQGERAQFVRVFLDSVAAA